MNINYIDKIDELIDKYPVEIVFDNIIYFYFCTRYGKISIPMAHSAESKQ